MVKQHFNSTLVVLTQASLDTHPEWKKGHVYFLSGMDKFFKSFAAELRRNLEELSLEQKEKNTVCYETTSLPLEAWTHFFSASFRRMCEEKPKDYRDILKQRETLPARESQRLTTKGTEVTFVIGETDYQIFSLDLSRDEYTEIEYYDYFFGLDGWRNVQKVIDNLQMTAHIMLKEGEKDDVEFIIGLATWEGDSIASKLNLVPDMRERIGEELNNG